MHTIFRILASLSIARYGSLAVSVISLVLALKILKKGLSIVFTVIAILAALYFLAPGLYTTVLGFITGLFA